MGLREPATEGPTARHRSPFVDKTPVFGVIERGGARGQDHGRAGHAGSGTLRPLVLEHVDSENTLLMSDAHPAYRSMSQYLPHEVINHEIEYVRKGGIHTQNIENYWSIFKRGLHGIFHHVSVRHLPMYLKEFDFRASSRRVSDGVRFAALLGQVRGRLAWYCQTPRVANPYA